MQGEARARRSDFGARDQVAVRRHAYASARKAPRRVVRAPALLSAAPHLPMTRRLLSVLLLFVAIFLVVVVRYRPPAPEGTEAPPDRFSAIRARETQRVLSSNGRPRAMGSDASAEARTWLEAELVKNGWRTEIQRAMSCTRHGTCGRVANIVATRAGREPGGKAILMMAHYDSVPCSPGASDDGMGTATVIEAARALAASPPPRRDMILVLTDGEEAGLLGAEAFVHQHPLASTIGGVVNVDARGSRGPSAMFETSTGNSWVVGLLARRGQRPVTSSLFYEIYRRMPNDTDFSSVKLSAHGVNFANIAGVEHYHTPLDSFENADPGTLQHHGDQALAMARALAESGPELESPRDVSRDAVWFDILSSFIVRWPASASVGLALLSFCLVLGGAIRVRAWGLGLLAPLAALVAAALASVLVGKVLAYGGAIPVPWVAHPLPAIFSVHLASIAAGLTAARFAARRSTPQVLWAGTWLTWGALGVVAALIAPGASYLLVVPAFVAGFIGWLPIDLGSAVPALVGAVLWLPIAILAYDGLGLIAPAVLSLSSTMLVTTLPALGASPHSSPKAPRLNRILGLSSAAAVLLLTALAMLVPAFSAEVPQRVNIVFRQDDVPDGPAPRARVYVEAAWGYMPWGRPPEAMVRALGEPSLVGTDTILIPGAPRVPFAEVPRIAIEAPRAEVLERSSRAIGSAVRARLVSSRGARTLVLLLPHGVRVNVDGQTAIPRNDMLVLRAVPAEGIELVFELDGGRPGTLTLLDITPGLPPASAAPIAEDVLGARDARAVQTQEGDVTIAARRIAL